MDHVKRGSRRLWRRPTFIPLYLAGLLLLGGLLVFTNHPLGRLTDEDEYMPLGLQDLLAGRNPYATGRGSDHAIDLSCVRHDDGCWYSYPYLPLGLALQIPVLDYRWTALTAFAALAWAIRDRPLAFFTFANPLALILAVSGFTDLVVIALLAWSMKTQNRVLAWLAAGSKQFALPVIVLYYGLRREWRRLGETVSVTALVVAPFLLWDASSFLYWTVGVHIAGTDHKWLGVLGIGHGNYLLYYAFLATVIYPNLKASRATSDQNAVPLTSTLHPTAASED